MRSGSSWQKWRRTLPTLCFITQYYTRMFLLELWYMVRTFPYADIAGQARERWPGLCRTFTFLQMCQNALQQTKERLMRQTLKETLHTLRQELANEHWQRRLAQARRALEHLIFVEEHPSQPTARPGLTANQARCRLPCAILQITQKRKATQRYMRTLSAAGRVMLLLITLALVCGLLSQALHTIQQLGISSIFRLTPSEISIRAHRLPAVNASHALTRISQLDESEYTSQAEYSTWAYSACSAASITEVLNAYGYHYRITDVLHVEAGLGEITPQLGLMENSGIANTARHFGFQTNWSTHWTLEQVISSANLGRPVIVSWPPERYDGGHIVVVTGGDAESVSLADSSRWNRHVLSHAQFLQWWAGFAAVLVPAAH